MASTIPAGMTFGQWHDTIPGLATGSPYDPNSFYNTLNNIGSQATQNFNAYLGASPSMQSAGVQPLTHTAMDPSVAQGVANGWLSASPGAGLGGGGTNGAGSSMFNGPSNPQIAQEDAFWARANGGGAGSGMAQATATPSTNISALYQNLLGRTPDAAGLDFYSKNLASGATSIADIANDIRNSPEYLASHPGGTTGMTSTGGGYGTSSNPYEGRQADAIRAQQQQFLDQAMNNIRSGAVAVGGLGGTRQGVAQGVAAGQAATGLDSALANLYGSNYNADQNRALTQYGMDQNFYNAQRGLDQSGAQLGANLYNLGQQGQWMPYQQYTNVLSPWSGFGTTTSGSSQGGGVQGAVGGALSGAALGHMAGWW
jgi:hypothetical protein